MKWHKNIRYHWIWLQLILLYGFLLSPNIQAARKFAYRPPNLGTATHRTGAALRQLKFGTFVQVLVPNHVALTNNSQPRLYWYYVLRSRKRYIQEFQIRLKDSDKLLFKKRLPMLNQNGIESIDLAKYGITLKPNKIYVWQISLQQQRIIKYRTSRTITSKGEIKHIDTNSISNNTAPNERPYLAASQGFWYDALDGVSQLINQGQNSSYWHNQRAILLTQGNLKNAAKYDRKIAAKRH
ncbi:hypothetical protein TI05_12365 [Achromatium sp. WMS3]|nr:hypothetical protein TI05_12365 [Achromatium sp. WMS3]